MGVDVGTLRLQRELDVIFLPPTARAASAFGAAPALGAAGIAAGDADAAAAALDAPFHPLHRPAPRLLEALENERNPVRTLAALELLSCQSFPTARAEELPAIYRGWWNEHESETASAWFASALGARAYDDPVLEKLASGQPSMDTVPVLIRAIADGDWFIRANANLWLRRITLEDFGEVSRFTAPEEIRGVQTRWRIWWENR